MSQAISGGGTAFGVTGELRIPSPLYSTCQSGCSANTPNSAFNTAYSEVILWNGSLGGTGVNLGTEANWKVPDGTNNNFLGMQGLEGGGVAALKKHRLTPDTVWLAQFPKKKPFLI